jgi:hypothetical protein
MVNWKLLDDPRRPNKRSKSIKIVFDDDAVALWMSKSEAEREHSDKNICRFIEQKLHSFDPRHTSPKYSHPPGVEWIIEEDGLGS